MADQPSAATTATQVPADQGSPDLSPEKMMQDNLLLLGVIFFIFYFLLIRPHQKRLKQHQELMKKLAKGNKILTSGGLIGVIIKFEGDDVVVIEISPNVRVRVSRASVSEVLSEKAGVESANDN
jgi:preprotein translocase subunit YajC